MLATYAGAAAVCLSSLIIGQAAIALCGVRGWSWLSGPVGLALLCAVCWATVRLPGNGAVSAVALLALTIAALALLLRRPNGADPRAVLLGVGVAIAALVAASLAFLAEGHYGILGTGFNPDMSQHLLAADRLAEGHSSELLRQGYPLGPHAVVVALNKGLGIGLVQGFSGLTVAVAVLAPLAALCAFPGGRLLERAAPALVVGLPYLVASYFAQGAFKETIQALFLLAFVLSLREASRNPDWSRLPLRFVPAAVIAIGSVYTYSFPGLIWLAGAALAWAIAEAAWARFVGSPGGGAGGTAPEEASAIAGGGGTPAPTGPAVLRAVSLALVMFVVGALPELGRMIDFHSFETFDPNGPGLGNLFGQVSPFTALGIWPSGDFRLAPGDGAVPALVYYLGAAFATVLLAHGVIACLRRREPVVLGGAAAAAVIYAASRAGGTPYTSAKALEIAAPLLTLVILFPYREGGLGRFIWSMSGKVAPRRQTGGLALAAAAAWAYLLAAGACSLLAFANAPVGPASYSAQLTGLRPLIAADSTLVLAPRQLLSEEQGERYIAWELRGGRVCIVAQDEAGTAPRRGIRFIVSWSPERPSYPGIRLRRRAGPYLLWERRQVPSGVSPCPLIAVRQARQGPAP